MLSPHHWAMFPEAIQQRQKIFSQFPIPSSIFAYVPPPLEIDRYNEAKLTI